MPIYVYRCQDCSELHEAFLRGSRPEPTNCPACGKATLQRIVAAHARPITSGGDMCDVPSGGCGMGACGGDMCAYPN